MEEGEKAVLPISSSSDPAGCFPACPTDGVVEK